MADDDRADELQTMLEIRDFLQDIFAGSEVTDNSRAAAAEFVASLDAKYGTVWHFGPEAENLWPKDVIDQALRLREIFSAHGLSAEWARVGGVLATEGFVVGVRPDANAPAAGRQDDEEVVGKEAIRLLDLWTETDGAEDRTPYHDTMALLGKPNGAGWIWAKEVRLERDVEAEMKRTRALALEAVRVAEEEAERLREEIARLTAGRQAGGSEGPARPVVSIMPMPLSDGRTDYFVSIRVGDKDVTPHAFREEYKAAYHVALYDWLLNGTGEEPCPVDFGPDDWPARVIKPTAPGSAAEDIAGTQAETLELASEFEGEAKAHGALGDKEERRKCLRAAHALRHLAAMHATHGTRTLHDPFLGEEVKIPDGLLDRLNGRYAVGPMMPNGQPEFGWREFEVPPIHKEAAAVIESLLGIRKEPTSH